MNLVWHIVKKDLRRFWVGMVLLVGLMVLKLILIYSVYSAEISRDWVGRMSRYQIFLLLAEWILTFFLAVSVVQEDPVPERGAFWEILPITRYQLLWAKLTSVTLLCAGSTFLTLAIGWLVMGLPVGMLGWPLLVLAQAQFGLCLLAFIFGSLTNTLAQLIFWLIGVWLAFCIPAILSENHVGIVSAGSQFTGFFLLNVTWIVGGVAIVLIQYAGLARKLSFSVLAAAVLLAAFFMFSPYNFDVTGWVLPAQARLEREVNSWPVEITKAQITKPKGDGDAVVLLHMTMQAENSKRLVGVFRYYTKWRFGDEVTPSSGRIYQALDNTTKQAIVRVLSSSTLSESSPLHFGAESSVPSIESAQTIGRPTPYIGQLATTVRTVSVEGQMDIAQGAKLHAAFGSSEITSVKSEGSLLRVSIMDRDAGLNPDPGWYVGLNALLAPQDSFVYALVNSKTQTVVTASRTSQGIGAYAYGIAFARGNYQFVLPTTETRSLALTDWKIVKIRFGFGRRATKVLTDNLVLKEVPTIERDPAWLE